MGDAAGARSGARALVGGRAHAVSYFGELPTSVKTVLTMVPTDCTATMINTAIRLAMSA